MKIRSSLSTHRRRLVAVLGVVLLVVAAWTWWGDSSHTTIRVEFTSAEGLHVNDAVKVLGVSVGKVTAIENRGDDVEVTVQVDASQPVPADAHAAIVAPSLVSGRFVQLAPVWTGGPRLQDGATIDVRRTAVPVTFDEVKQQLTDLATTLGPTAGRHGGALSATIVALDRSLRHGNPGQLRSAIEQLRGAADAAANGRSDLFSTIDNLDRFTRNLAVHDAAVRGFTRELAAVSTTLATNRTTLHAALRGLSTVLTVAKTYLDRHGRSLTRTVSDLNLLMAAIADRSNQLAGVLHVAPHAIIGLGNAIENQGIATRSSLTGFDDVAQLLCGAVLGTGGTSQQCHDAVNPLLTLLGLDPGPAR
jgi:phospholipid/cholesterol/gamma-HCH transport system substrate-binding protein